jgi:hypothetical protein
MKSLDIFYFKRLYNDQDEKNRFGGCFVVLPNFS